MFQPNHFVPLIRVSDSEFYLNELDNGDDDLYFAINSVSTMVKKEDKDIVADRRSDTNVITEILENRDTASEKQEKRDTSTEKQ